MSRAVWMDRVYDRDYASDGVSRYAAYVRSKPDAFEDAWSGSETARRHRFAAAAWWVACPPVMSPGLVRCAPGVWDVRVDASGWDEGLVVAATLATGWPEELRRSRGWQAGALWRDWPEEHGRPVPPTEREVAAAPYLMGHAMVQAPLRVPGLPLLGGPGPDLEAAAMAAVSAVADAVNTLIAPIVDKLGGAE